jgi:hypothetical protein
MGFTFRAQGYLLVASMAVGGGVAAVAAAGCSSSSNGSAPQPDAASEASVIDTGAVDGANVEPDSGEAAAAPVVSVTWQIVAQVPAVGTGESDGGARTPISGVKVCIYQMASIPCATTDGSGTFTLTGVPAKGNFVLVADKEGYRSIASPIVTAGLNLNGLSSPLAMALATAPDPGIDGGVDWTGKGQIQFFALGPGAIFPDGGPEGVPGATVTLSPESGVSLFLTDQNTFDFAATKLVDVAGVAYDVTPGTYTLTFDAPDNDCEAIAAPFAGWGYPAAAHQVTFPVIAGYTTGTGVYCAPTGSSTPPDGGSPDDAGGD